MCPHIKAVAKWSGGALILTGMPLLGVWLAGNSLAPFLEFPPRTRFAVQPAFSWPAFIGLALLIILIVGGVACRVISSAAPPRRRNMTPFPWWGWLGLLSGAATWVLAWSRFPWFAPLQPFTFTPLWLSYILVMNALTFRHSGRSPLTHDTHHYLTLFPLSAVFWWFFEYLNRFVENWHYGGLESLSATAYVCRAMLPFATVLPAFVATQAWLEGYPRLSAGLGDWIRVDIRYPRRLAGIALGVAATGLAGIGIRPDLLFPLLWLSPLVVLASLRALGGTPTLINDPGRGDWQRLVLAATAALVCGFFWELWNYRSLEKWIYTVPYVDRFHLFEMPLLGYAGYLPFGIECALVCELVRKTRKEPPS